MLKMLSYKKQLQGAYKKPARVRVLMGFPVFVHLQQGISALRTTHLRQSVCSQPCMSRMTTGQNAPASRGLASCSVALQS